VARSSRALWLPVVAVSLPCVFLGVIAARWLGLEREAAARRSELAARAFVSEMAAGLGEAAAAVAPHAEARLRRDPTPRLPLALGGTLVTGAFLFDRDGRLIAPSELTEDPAPETPGTAAGLELVAAAARALGRGGIETAGRLANQVFSRHPSDRDEFGVAVVSYAAWQRAKIGSLPKAGAAAFEELARDLMALVDDGHLGTPIDVSQMALLVAEHPGHPALERVEDAVRRASDRLPRDRDRARAASTWLEANGRDAVVSASPTMVAALRRSDREVAVIVPRPDGARVILLVEERALASWIAGWKGAGSPFDARLADAGVTGPDDAFELPLTTSGSGPRVVVRSSGSGGLRHGSVTTCCAQPRARRQRGSDLRRAPRSREGPREGGRSPFAWDHTRDRSRDRHDLDWAPCSLGSPVFSGAATWAERRAKHGAGRP